MPNNAFTYIEFDPPLNMRRTGESGLVLEVSEAAIGSSTREMLRSRLYLDTKASREGLLKFTVKHDLEEARPQYVDDDSDRVDLRSRVWPKEFSLYEVTPGIAYVTTGERTIREFRTRIDKTFPDSVTIIRKRRVDLKGLESFLKDLPLEVHINAYSLKNVRIGQVKSLLTWGLDLDQNTEVKSWVNRSDVSGIVMDIAYLDFQSPVFISESGTIVLSKDLGEVSSLEFVRWIDGQVANCSVLEPIRLIRRRGPGGS